MKKFTDKYINSWNILNKSVIGFEFEFYTEKSYYKLLELLNRELYPIKVHGYRKYHSSMKVDKDNFKIEPDLSGGADMVELITGPTKYVDSRIILLKILKILQKYSKTSEKSSLHINISFGDGYKDIRNVNVLKMILNIDENLIYDMFPNRKNNFYAMSVKNLVPFKSFDFISSSSDILINSMNLPDTKYRGINVNKLEEGRIEFRYIGGERYQYETKKILELLDYFVLLSWNTIDEEINKDDRKILWDYLNKNINNFKKYNKMENFISEFPTINLEINKNDAISIIKSYYGEIYDKLYNLISNIYNLNNCVINYDTDERKLEVINATFKTVLEIKNIKFIDCEIKSGLFENCDFFNTKLNNVHVEKSKLVNSEIYFSKVYNCVVDQTSLLKDCFFYGGVLNGEMDGGVFRGGKLGEYSVLNSNVKITTNKNNYFGLKYNEIEKGKTKNFKKKYSF
jgi:hypothetical protein